MAIGATDRCCLFGATNSGKTTLARHLLRSGGDRLQTVVLDPKHRYEDGDVPIVREYNPKLRQQIIRVPPNRYEHEWWAYTIDRVWERGDGILYVDELTLINTSRTQVMPELGKAIRTGRERGLGVISASQRPKDIPSAVFTESEHFFVFLLRYKPDRDKVVDFTTDEMEPKFPLVRRYPHSFLYFNDNDGRVIHARLKL